MITNKLIDINDVKKQIKYKVIKASNTNGLKQLILSIIDQEQKKRNFNKYETLNAINAIPRTQLYGKKSTICKSIYKYQLCRIIQSQDPTTLYDIKYDDFYETMTIIY